MPDEVGRPHSRLLDPADAGLIDRKPHPTSRRELVAGLTARGRAVVKRVTANRRDELARVVEKMPQRERRGLVRALTAFTAAGGEPAAYFETE
jgi:DNA-binding MarR family transcriptional regulator